MRNKGSFETATLDAAAAAVRRLLPSGWTIDWRQARNDVGDATVDIIGSGPARTSFVAEVKRSGSVPASLLVPALRDIAQRAGMPVVYISDYIGPGVRDALTTEGLSFADGTGWIRLVNDDPMVVLTGNGAVRSTKERGSSAITRLDGLASGRIIRALAASSGPAGVRALATTAAVSPGSVSKLVATLVREGIVDRDPDGSVAAVHRRQLVRRWAQDYSFTGTNADATFFLAPRGLPPVLDRLVDRADVLVTGSAGARRLLPTSATSVVPLGLLAVYTDAPADLASRLRLVPTPPHTANVVLARPQDPALLERVPLGGLEPAPPALVLADLMTLPGRSDAEADQLMDAMALTDASWSS